MDYCEINKWTKQDHNLLPNIQTALENLQEGELYLKFDIRWGYKNLRVRKEDQHKAVFKTMFRTYILKVTYFRLMNMPPTFQQIIYQDLWLILQKYPKNFGNYLDNTWIVTWKNPEGRALHQQITYELFNLLEEKSYFLKLGKCQFKQESMDLLGWTVGNGEIWIDPNKIPGLKMWPTKLTTHKQAQVTMGLMNYIRPAIKGYAEMARPITEAIKKKNLPFKWTRECKRALEYWLK